MAQAKTYQKPVMFQHIATSAEGTADSLTIQVLPDEMIGVNTDDFIFICKGRTTAGLELSGLTAVYSKTTGLVTVTGTITTADVITLIGVFGTI